MIKIFIFFVSFTYAQSIDVTFRYVEIPSDNFLRVFVPGTMPTGSNNDWGPNSNGFISPDAPSQMIYNEATDSYEKSYNLDVNEQYLYKIHFHHNSSGTNNSWISDPLNPEVTDDEWNNSILNVTDPLFFQPARHMNENNYVDGFSIGIFSSSTVDSILYCIGDDTLNGTSYYQENGIFHLPFNPPQSLYDPLWIQASIEGQLFEVYNVGSVDVVEEPLPDGVEMGPNWMDDTMVLALYAPAQPLIKVIVTSPGNSGDDSDAIIMNKDPELEDTWWIELDLPEGQYEYEYLLINGNRIADPLSRRLSNGRTLIEIGPGGVSTADDYNWQSSSYVRPSLDTLVIYELHVDDFAAQGNGQGQFSDVISRLDHLKSVGVNAIELLPITDFPGTHSWGYDPHLISAVESRYGSPADLKLLVDEAHMKGIAVIVDLVWNHIRSSSPVWEIQPDYSLNPYIKYHTELNPNETEGSWGMLDWDHFNSKTVEYINKVNRIWIDEYKVDGFRFDATRMMGWDINQPEYGFPAWTAAISNIDSTIYQIAEHLPADPWLIENTNMTSAWHDSFHDVILSDAHGQFNSATTFMRQVVQLHEYSNVGNNYNDRKQAVKYMISHDEQSILQEMVVFNNYSIQQARERDKFYATIMFTSLGIPMLFQGQEFGLQTGWNDDNNNGNYDEEKLQYRPVDWSLLDSEIGQSHLVHYRNLIKFRKKNPALHRGTFYDLWRYESERVIVYGYKDESVGNNGEQVVVIANFSEYDRTVNDVPFLSAGDWYNVFDPGNDLNTEDGNYGEYFISAKTAIVYSNNDWQLDVENSNTIPENFGTLDLYPNPFNGTLNISFTVDQKENSHISIYDITGRLIEKFAVNDSPQTLMKWDTKNYSGGSLSTGVYIVSLKTTTGVTNKKVLFLK